MKQLRNPPSAQAPHSRRAAASPSALQPQATTAGATSPRQLKQQERISQLRNADSSTAHALPAALRKGVESLSGQDLSDVRVHRNSSEPAQLNALAYAQGRDIHLAPGQERHLPHEAWHVVQQAQGRVKPKRQIAGRAAVNDEARLEREADLMGERGNAAQRSETKGNEQNQARDLDHQAPQMQRKPLPSLNQEVMQPKGERAAVLSTRDTGRSAGEAIRRGNRRASISATGGRSSAKLAISYEAPHQALNTGYRNKVGELRQYVKQRMVDSGRYTVPQANQLIDSNDTFLQAKAVEEISVGNCGEFGMVVFSHLVQNTSGQYAYRCAMNGTVPGTTQRYDHCFVFTYPNSIAVVPNATDVTGVDRNLATIADAWDGYQVMTLESFMNGGNAYGTQLTDNNIVIKEGRQATGLQVFSPEIEGYIRDWAVSFNQDFNNQMLDPGSTYATVATSRALNPTGFNTQGSNVVGVNDSRTLAQKLANSTALERADILNTLTDDDINTLAMNARIVLLAELPVPRVVAYIDHCWNRGFFQKFAYSAFPYKSDVIASMDPLRAHQILQAMPHAQRTRIRRDMPSDAIRAIDDAAPMSILIV